MSMIGGTIYMSIDGVQQYVKGDWTYGLGKPLREGIAGSSSVHGYKETTTVPFIEGEITDTTLIKLDDLAKIVDSTVTMSLANGKVIALRNAWCCNQDGLSGSTDEGTVKVRFEGMSAEEIVS